MGEVVSLPVKNQEPSREYIARHHKALQEPRGVERPLVALRAGLLEYGIQYEAQFAGCQLGQDGVLGDAWLEAARGFVALLNGPSGRLDCGTLDGEVRRFAERFGFGQKEIDSL